MTSIFRVYDHFCKPLTQLDAPTTPRAWVLNGYGEMDFSISIADPKCTETNLQIGNLVYVTHIPAQDGQGNTNGKLPDWFGIILPPRGWDEGVLHAKAYSAEAILDFRPMPIATVSGTPKQIFLQLLQYANGLPGNTINIQPGILDDMPVTYTYDIGLSAYKEIQKLIEKTGMDWDVTGEVDARGSLQLYANLYIRKGYDSALILTNTNSEQSSPLLTEQGTPYNYVIGYSHANTKQGRYRVEVVNQAALDDYGLLAINQTFVGIHDEASLRNAAQALADDRGRPKKLTTWIVLDKGAAFDSLSPGNTVAKRDNHAGFRPGGGFGYDARARIISVNYNDLSNKCPLNIEVI